MKLCGILTILFVLFSCGSSTDDALENTMKVYEWRLYGTFYNQQSQNDVVPNHTETIRIRDTDDGGALEYEEDVTSDSSGHYISSLIELSATSWGQLNRYTCTIAGHSFGIYRDGDLKSDEYVNP